jgi:hypothetical protein
MTNFNQVIDQIRFANPSIIVAQKHIGETKQGP